MAAMRRCVLTWIAVLTMSFAGCAIARPDTIVKHPDAPMLIVEARGWVYVAIYDTTENRLVEYGWVDVSRLDGWTVHKYDWGRVVGDLAKPEGGSR